MTTGAPANPDPTRAPGAHAGRPGPAPAGTAAVGDHDLMPDSPTLREGHADADHGRVTTVTPSELLPGITGTLIGRASASFQVTDTWLATWRACPLDENQRGTVLSVMAGTQQERRHPSLRHVPLDLRGAVAVPCGETTAVVYRDTPTGPVWLAVQNS